MLCRHLAQQVGLPPNLWPDAQTVPLSARLDLLTVPQSQRVDLFGLAYERFFSDLFRSDRGQYFTPQPFVALMADLAAVREGERVLDPACGAGGFLVEAHRRGARSFGVEIDGDLVHLCRLNLVLAGASEQQVKQGDALRSLDVPSVDVVLANPPFSMMISDGAALEGHALCAGRPRVRSEVLFLAQMERVLVPGGRLVTIVPRSLLSNVHMKFVRDWLAERFVRRGIISLPEGAFRPFGGTAAKGVILSLQKRPASPRKWVAVSIERPGYDPARRRFVPEDVDEIAQLRVQLRCNTAPVVDADAPQWLPERLPKTHTIARGVPRCPLLDIAPHRSGRIRPSADPEGVYAEVDLADADHHTGEIHGAHTRFGHEIRGEKTPFQVGDVLFSRLRPERNKVIAVGLAPPTPASMYCGSSEWIRLQPTSDEQYFALVAARSSFVRSQVKGTGGQTHPRVRLDDLKAVMVPDPGEAARRMLSAVVADAHRRRQEARQDMDDVSALYEAFGHGEISAEALQRRLLEIQQRRGSGER